MWSAIEDCFGQQPLERTLATSGPVGSRAVRRAQRYGRCRCPDRLEERVRIFFHREDHAKAAEHYRKSLEIRPDDPQILNNLGVALVQLEHPEEALAAYQ
ncbi:MAG: tetratricopeptide repeat protein, partial [Acidimicrobiia bacterium]